MATTQQTQTRTDADTANPFGIELKRFYNADEVSEALGLRRRKTIYEIPEEDLPRYRVGPGRRTVRFLGRDLVNYLQAA